eukprot:NODE_7112_length_460_cov_578.681481.p2 GENE.NODE_7112_length_460_cov_578.681481~~NODE_7112_length_460_cov_578.681481.p2  ORF type:complete len:54 (+),score=5.46 NODE_7112_length_460_cov_578.681481:137-298(+)
MNCFIKPFPSTWEALAKVPWRCSLEEAMLRFATRCGGHKIPAASKRPQGWRGR